MELEIARSRAFNAGRALVHRWLAHLERPTPGGTVGIFASAAATAAAFEGHPAPSECSATFAGGSETAAATLVLTYRVPGGRLIATHRDAADGGALLAVTYAAEADRHAAREPAWERNRALAFAHRWLWAWESDGPAALSTLLDERSASAREAVLLARSAAAGATHTHHMLRSLILDPRDGGYAATLEIDWRGESAGGTPLRARVRHALLLRETGAAYPLLAEVAFDVVHSLEPDLAPADSHAWTLDTPSDDAESGGA